MSGMDSGLSFERHRPGARRIEGYEAPIDLSRIASTKADQELIRDPAAFQPEHFLWKLEGSNATITLNRPEKKNPLTFDSYAELRDTFMGLEHCPQVRSVVICGAGGNFSTGGDVVEIIEPLIGMDYQDRLAFTMMTGDLIKAIRRAPQPIISQIEGLCFGAGAAIAMASDLRVGTKDSKIGFIFTRVGLGGCDMGACSLLPRIIGEGRAREILIWGLPFNGEEAAQNGFYNRVFESPAEMKAFVAERVSALDKVAPRGVALTKRSLSAEYSMELERSINFEAEMQARAMADPDFAAYCRAFQEKRKAVFSGEAPPDQLLSATPVTRLPQVNLPGWKHPGYAHAVDCSNNSGGRHLHGSGMTGMNQEEVIINPRRYDATPDPRVLLNQLGDALGNIRKIIDYAGEHPEHLVEVQYYVVDSYVELFNDSNFRKEVGAAYQNAFGKVYPGSALIGVSRLLDPNALIEVKWSLIRPND